MDRKISSTSLVSAIDLSSIDLRHIYVSAYFLHLVLVINISLACVGYKISNFQLLMLVLLPCGEGNYNI